VRRKIIRITTVPTSLKILLKGQLKFINEKKNFEIIGVSSPGVELDDVSKEEGITCYPIYMTRKINPLSDIVSIFKLFFLFRNLKPHIVHTHTPKAGMVGMIAAFLARVPYRFHTVAGMPLMEKSGPLRLVLLIIEKIIYKLSVLVLPNSNGLRDFIISNNLVSKNKLKVIGFGSSNGINLEYYNASEEINIVSEKLKKSLNIQDSDIVFLFVGRVVSHKGVNELIQAFNRLQKEFKFIKLLVVGGFEDNLDPISQTSKDLLYNGNIIHVGFQSDVRPFFSLSDVFVFPSYREGFPNVVMQACAFKLPCIVTDISGCNELIINDYNGFIIPPKDSNAIFTAMKKFILNPILLHSFGENSRNMLMEKFEQNFYWNEVINLYENTI
jgi:glycosyltransferase involved in cell wall biosynthesis